MMNQISVWQDTFGGIPSEEAIRRQFDPGTHRVSKRLYPKGTRFPGAMIAGTCFVLQGECKYSFGNFEIILKEGEFGDLPEGGYEFETRGNHDLVIVLVWPLPEWAQSKKSH